MSCKLINSYIKISSLELMIKHKQFNLNRLTKHILIHKNYFENTVSVIVKPSVTIPGKIIIHRFTLVNPQFTAIPDLIQPIHDLIQYFQNLTTQSAVAVTAAPMGVQKFISIRSQGLGPIKRPLTVSFSSNIRKVLKE